METIQAGKWEWKSFHYIDKVVRKLTLIEVQRKSFILLSSLLLEQLCSWYKVEEKASIINPPGNFTVSFGGKYWTVKSRVVEYLPYFPCWDRPRVICTCDPKETSVSPINGLEVHLSLELKRWLVIQHHESPQKDSIYLLSGVKMLILDELSVFNILSVSLIRFIFLCTAVLKNSLMSLSDRKTLHVWNTDYISFGYV